MTVCVSISDASEGSCMIYDRYNFALFIMKITMISKGVSLIFYGISYILSRRSNVTEDKVDKE